jgi:hypothetical protein
MKTGRVVAALVGSIVVSAPAPSSAQQPVTSFSQLADLLKPGDSVSVTDAQGREVHGRIHALGSDALTLDGTKRELLPASAIQQVVRREGSRAGRGALWGLIGGAMLGGVVGGSADDGVVCKDGSCALLGAAVFGGFGALTGAIVGTFVEGKPVVVYRAHDSRGAQPARLSVAPVVTPRTRGVAVAFAF